MTTLTKPIHREVAVPRFNRPVVVTIDPETQKIILREKGCRTEYAISIAALYALLVKES
ncbi:MAG: hypothetical protein NT147_03075 [Candidatus Aminicenantes bacterium]|jgi:hypothetical protein|nr:hypothetical protein [Candidatus Aminicenantes bacterium]